MGHFDGRRWDRGGRVLLIVMGWWDIEGMDVKDVNVVEHRRDGHGGYERGGTQKGWTWRI